MTMCYMAGAIDMVIPSTAQGWRKKVAAVPNSHGIHAFDPASAFSLARTDNDTWLSKKDVIMQINNLALDNSEIVLAEMEFNCQHTGTTMEIIRANEQEGKTLVIWNSSEYTPLYLTSLSNAVILSSLSECVDYIVSKVSGSYLSETEKQHLSSSPVASAADISTIKVKLHPGHPLLEKPLDTIDPTMLLYKKYDDDTGYDIMCAQDIVVPAGGKVKMPTHLSIQPPAGYWYRLVARSSTFHNFGMLVIEGIIDTQFRGALFCNITNLSDQDVFIQAGDSVAQVIFQEIIGDGWNIEVSAELDESVRGEGGFGSTTSSKKYILDEYQKHQK